MEIIVISAMFFAIVLAGAGLAVTLVVRAVRADHAYIAHVEEGSTITTAEPTWVRA